MSVCSLVWIQIKSAFPFLFTYKTFFYPVNHTANGHVLAQGVKGSLVILIPQKQEKGIA